MSESGPTYEQAPALFEAASAFAASAERWRAASSELTDAFREMSESFASGAAAQAAFSFAQGIAALAQPPLRERERAARKAWEARILARLASPTEDDRAEAAEMAAWLRRTSGDVLPLL